MSKTPVWADPAKVRTERKDAALAAGQPYLDPLSYGDVAVLHNEGRQLMIILGRPRAVFDKETRILEMSRQIALTSNPEWHREMIYAQFPNWRQRKEINQHYFDNLLRF